jgi:glucose/arabinose dehydrogenase
VDGKDTDVMLHSRGLVSSFTFYTGQMFPERYYNGVFATLRVSRNGGELGGKIVFIPFNDKHEPLGVYEDFLTGFVETSNAPVFWGEPSGIVMMQDGSLIFSDEANGRIYRISYRGPEKGRHYVSP